ncbi:brassinosteroid-related acyltransferase 1-like [Chenopodium quinoa]|uniref:brassinosteroid-related acyltransferase 1-like n=1 Tax=Chenopodium quinoa TaxID=63459 RepID=UPI000B772A72|nr:brassinosteroid-related acyltransferase 1-like [Chenopodium quinoa]
MASVFVTKKVNVYPKTMQPTKIMKLSNLDRQCPTLMYLVFFYNPSHNHNYSNDYLFSSLKLGLEETLSLWYPAAGRLSKNPNNGNKLDLWCNNGGAIMVEAVTQTRVSDLGNLFQYNEFFDNLVYKPTSEMPLLVAQVTKFGCGGYSIGVGTSHALFDGQATFNFLSAWASKTQATKLGIKALDWHKPVHDRERLLHLNSNNNNPEAALTKVAAIQHLYQLITQAAPSGGMLMNPQLFVPSSIKDDCALRTFHFTSSMIDTLKRRTYGLNSYSSSSCSSFEIVTAHLWKARTKALGLRRERMVCLQFAVDTRTRLTPQLSQGFSGNAYVLASVALTAGELELASYETLVNKIKMAKNSVDNDYVSTYLEVLEGSGDALPSLRELTMVSDWTRMPFHKVNFMHPYANSAVSACPLTPPVPQVAYFMQSPKEDKGIDVRIGLNSQILTTFSHYFLNNIS